MRIRVSVANEVKNLIWQGHVKYTIMIIKLAYTTNTKKIASSKILQTQGAPCWNILLVLLNKLAVNDFALTHSSTTQADFES
jgi:hypothetical protein